MSPYLFSVSYELPVFVVWPGGPGGRSHLSAHRGHSLWKGGHHSGFLNNLWLNRDGMVFGTVAVGGDCRLGWGESTPYWRERDF